MRTPYADRPVTPPTLNNDRAALLDWARTTPLVYGRDSWRAFKALYKQAERANDPELFSALIARIDALAFGAPQSEAARGTYNPISALAASRDHLLLHFSQSARLESRPISPFPMTGGAERGLGISASGIAWLGERGYAVFAGVEHRMRSGVLQIYDFSAPGQAKQIASVATGVPLCVAATETHVFVLVAPSYQPAVTASQGWGQFIERTAAFIQGRQPAASEPLQNTVTLHVFDLTNPANPDHVAAIAVPDAAKMSLHGPHLVIAAHRPPNRYGQASQSANDGVTIIDVSQPLEPRILGRVPVTNAQAVAATDRAAFVLTKTQTWPAQTGLTVVDLSDPMRPGVRGSLELSGNRASQSLTVLGEYVCVLLDYPVQLQCIDCSNLDHPVVIHTLPILGNAYGACTLTAQGTQVYVGTSQGIIEFDMTDPKHPFQLGDPPSAKTVGYMKRRARRALRALAQTDANTYVETAFALLTDPDAQGESLDPATQWAAHDVLYGAGGRFTQTHHGRGALKALKPRLPRTPEYRSSDAWRARPDLAARLFDSPNRPWQTYDAALKMLRAARAPMPSVTQENLARFLRSESPLLIRQAARSVAERAATGESLGAVLLADAWYLGNAAIRRALAVRIGEVISDAKLAPGFAARLFERATGHHPSGAFSRRQETTLLLLASQFPRAFFGKDVLPSLGWLLSSKREEIISWTLNAFSQSATELTPDWLAALEPVEPVMRQRALNALIASIAGRSLNAASSRALVHADTPWKRVAGWRALAASATPSGIIHDLWDELFNAPDDSEALATALSTPDALATLDRTIFTPEQILSQLQSRPALARLLAPEAFATFALSLPARALVPLLATVSEESWQALRSGLLAVLQDPARSLAFWKAAWETLPEQPDAILQGRILSDDQIADTFLLTHDPEFLNTTAIALGPLLMRWADAHTDLFPRGSADLLAAATHALPEMRAWGLERAQSLRLDLPFALRLMESELPTSVRVGQAYFETAESIMENALALCDSPVATVRAYGQARIALNWSKSHQTTLVLEQLCENPHPEMQAFLAQLLLDVPLIPEGASTFDRAVLRGRGKARPAKELVKKRGSRNAEANASPQDVAMLLEVARSRTPRDSEWALSRLAALAVAGEKIDGVTIDGAAGI